MPEREHAKPQVCWRLARLEKRLEFRFATRNASARYLSRPFHHRLDESCRAATMMSDCCRATICPTTVVSKYTVGFGIVVMSHLQICRTQKQQLVSGWLAQNVTT